MNGYVELRGGLTVPEASLALLLDLERRDLRCRQDGDNLRIATAEGGRPNLSEDDTAAIRKWKTHLLALMAYVAPGT